MQEHLCSYMAVFLLSRLKKVGSNMLVLANPYVQPRKGRP